MWRCWWSECVAVAACLYFMDTLQKSKSQTRLCVRWLSFRSRVCRGQPPVCGRSRAAQHGQRKQMPVGAAAARPEAVHGEHNVLLSFCRCATSFQRGRCHLGRRVYHLPPVHVSGSQSGAEQRFTVECSGYPEFRWVCICHLCSVALEAASPIGDDNRRFFFCLTAGKAQMLPVTWPTAQSAAIAWQWGSADNTRTLKLKQWKSAVSVFTSVLYNNTLSTLGVSLACCDAASVNFWHCTAISSNWFCSQKGEFYNKRYVGRFPLTRQLFDLAVFNLCEHNVRLERVFVRSSMTALPPNGCTERRHLFLESAPTSTRLWVQNKASDKCEVDLMNCTRVSRRTDSLLYSWMMLPQRHLLAKWGNVTILSVGVCKRQTGRQTDIIGLIKCIKWKDKRWFIVHSETFCLIWIGLWVGGIRLSPTVVFLSWARVRWFSGCCSEKTHIHFEEGCFFALRCQSPSTIGEERQYNPFLRSHSPDLHLALGVQQFQDEDWTQFRARVLEELRKRKDLFNRR